MKPAPNPTEVQHLQFKQSTSRQICEAVKTIPTSCSLITTDCKRGLIYIAHDNEITVVTCSDKTTTSQTIQHTLPSTISRISLSCDFSYASVTFDSSTAHIYNASSICKQSLELLHEIQFSSSPQSVFAYDLKWNPSIPGNFCTIASDNTIGSFSVKFEQKSTVSIIALEKIKGLEATCVAWSPKGKQIVIGCKNGSIIQLKPELKVARILPGPSSPSMGQVLAITWISNYQFCAAYTDANDHRINILIIDAPKGETKATFTNYEDVTFGILPENNVHLSRYYFEHIAEWNIIIAASSCSSEVAILGSNDYGQSWEQWLPIDSGRAQLPCIGGNETYPLGITIDKSPQQLLPWGEETLPHPMPMLHIFANSGRISSFYMVNLIPNCPSLCSPPWEPATIIASPSLTSVLSSVPLQQQQEQNTRISLLPHEISFTLNSATTSTPRPKQNLEEERMRMTSQFSAPAYSAIVVAAPEIDPRISKSRIEKVEPAEERSHKVEIENADPTPQISIKDEPIYDESLCLRVYKEEQTLFENELKQKLKPLIWECASEEDKQKLIMQSTKIEEFLGQLEETTSSLTSDISYLKALLLQSFIWIEETKSRNSANYNENYRDRHEKSKIKQLEKLYFNTQSQLIKATKALDIDWAECQSRDKLKMKMPSLEFIYQSLKCHAEIIAKEKYNLESYIQKWKLLSKNSKVTSLNRSMSKLSIGKCPQSSAIDGEIGGIEIRCKTIANNTKNFSRDKRIKLRDILLHTKTRIVKTINSSPVQERLEATLSSLTSLSPVPASTKPRISNTHLKSTLLSSSSSKPQFPINSSIQPVVSNAPQLQVEQSVPSSPLASLNSIVAQIGGGGAEAKGSITSSSQPLQFSMGSSLSPSFEVGLKNRNSQLGKPSSSLTQPAGATQLPPAFSKIINVSFGNTEQKQAESLSFGSKDSQIAQNTTTSSSSTKGLFPDTLFNTSAMAITKTGQQQQQPAAIALESESLSISLPASTTATTTQSVFSFANPPTFSAPTTTVDPSELSVGLSAKTKAQTTSPITTSSFGSNSKLSASIFGGQSGLSSSIFDKQQAAVTSAPAPAFGMIPNTGMSSINFGKLNLTSSYTAIPPPTSPSTSIFSITAGTSPPLPPTSSIFGQPSTISPVTTTAAASIFASATISQCQTTSPSTAAGTGIFGSSPTPTNNNPIFGGISGAVPAATPPPAASIFGGGTIFGNTSAATGGPFGSPTSPSIFGGGGGAKQQTAPSIFGGSATLGSPFGVKQVFETAQPIFGSPKPDFGGNAFGGQPTFGTSGGFNTPAIGAPAMGKVFGSPGNSTFESLAGQNGGMTFGSLAQKSPEKPPPPPAFSGGSSFSSWR